jgi:hypothetical protein
MKLIFRIILILFLVSSCNAEENIYSSQSLLQKEKDLQQIAAHLDQYQFSQLRAGNTTPAAWTVKNKTGTPVALLKCTAGNNYAPAEIAAYYLGKMLELPIYPVTIGVTLNPTLAAKLKTSPQYCALKEWYLNWSVMYWKAQANIAKIVKQKKYTAYKMKNSFLSAQGDNKLLADTLLCSNNLDKVKNDSIQLSSGIKTRNGDPLIKPGQPAFFISDKVSLLEVAKDFSNLMLLDAVMGNGDRFPGLNLEFRSSINKSQILNKQQVMILHPRLSSLDMGLSFKGWQPTWGRLEMTYYLRRFDPSMLKRLRKLLIQLDQLTSDDLQGKWHFLNFKTQMNSRITAIDYLKTNIQWVLDFAEKVSSKQNQEFIPGKKADCRQINLE